MALEEENTVRMTGPAADDFAVCCKLEACDMRQATVTVTLVIGQSHVPPSVGVSQQPASLAGTWTLHCVGAWDCSSWYK